MTTILLTGRTGQVGWELERILTPLGRVIALGRSEMELTRSDSIRDSIRAASPDIIVNAAGYTAVDKAEMKPDLAMQINAAAVGVMAEEAKRVNATLVHYSTDYVFDGMGSSPYREEDRPNPVNVYGRSKLAGEHAIAKTGCDHLILRTSWVYSSRSDANFVATILRLAQEREQLSIVNDQIGSPTWARALAQATSELIKRRNSSRDHPGIYHLSASGCTSRFDFAKRILELAREMSPSHKRWASIRSITSAEYPLPALRPLNVAVCKQKIGRIFGIEMSGWEEQLRSCLDDLFKKEGRSQSKARPEQHRC